MLAFPPFPHSSSLRLPPIDIAESRASDNGRIGVNNKQRVLSYLDLLPPMLLLLVLARSSLTHETSSQTCVHFVLALSLLFHASILFSSIKPPKPDFHRPSNLFISIPARAEDALNY